MGALCESRCEPNPGHQAQKHNNANESQQNCCKMTDKFGSSNLNVYEYCSLPEAMESPAIIQNPSNENETLIIGAVGMHNIYIYNHTTNTFSKNNKDDLTTILLTTEQNRMEICTVNAIKGLNETSIIVLGTARNDTHNINFQPPFYAVFDSKSLSFERIGSKIFNNDKIDTSNQLKNEKAIYNIDTKINNVKCSAADIIKYVPFWNRFSCFNTYKNYLVFTGCCVVGAYDISDEYNPILLMYIQLYSIEWTGHGAVILPCDMSDASDGNVVKLLTFGGCGIFFFFSCFFFVFFFFGTKAVQKCIF